MTSIALTLLFSSVTQTFSLPQGLLPALCFVESSYNVSAVHHDDGNGDSLGICQIKYKTAQWLGFQGTEEELMQPRINVYYAAKFLAHQIYRYNDVTRGIIAYNMGHAGSLQSTSYSVKVIQRWLEEFKQ